MPVNAVAPKEGGSQTKRLILSRLRSERAPVSGEDLAREAGVTRVAVWKSIRQLREAGYAVSASAHGYALDADVADGVFPWEFPEEPSEVRYWRVTDSTMNRALEAAISGAPSGSVFLAEEQTAGRGTSGRSWVSVPGNLHCSLVLRPRLIPAYAHRAVLAAQCALASSVEEVTGFPVSLRWPNDVASRPTDGNPARKIAGVLAEYHASGTGIDYLVLGIGVNLIPPRALSGAGSLQHGPQRGPQRGRRLAILDAFRQALPRYLASDDDLIAEWTARSADVGRGFGLRPGVSGESLPATDGIFLGPDRAGWARVSIHDVEYRFPPGGVSLQKKG